MSKEDFDRRSKELFNVRIGDFLYIHREANPVWHYFLDIYGNMVRHGGRGDATDCVVHIKAASREALEPRLNEYLKELVGRHGEELHNVGTKKYHGVTITLPPSPHSAVLQNLEVTIHTGSGCCYDQDEIAYEVMAALSGVPALKALAEPDSYHGFIRRDKIDDNAWINFLNEELGITVKFSPISGDDSYVVVEMYKHHPRENWEMFKHLMYECIDEYVKSRTGRNIVKQYGEQVFENENSKDQTRVLVGSGSLLSFCVTVPYSDHVSFIRWEYAKRAMSMLHEEFKKENVLV